MNQFQIISKLGSGSYSKVYKVRRFKDNKIYAMKQMKIPYLSDKERDNALNEIRIIASIKHPNIVAYKECFYDQANQSLCVVMEFADQGDLFKMLRNQKTEQQFLPEKRIWKIFIQVLNALKAVHDNFIVHRDLKSANILLCQDDLVKLADFNVSKILKNKMIQTQIGTPFYASPEIWRQQPYNHKSDIWSLGCILYEMCSLSTPFQGDSMTAIGKCVLRGNYPGIPSIYSKQINQLIRLMLQSDPQARPDCDEIMSLPQIAKNCLADMTTNSNFQLLGTIQWQINEEELDSKDETLDLFSLRLPPPHYTPVDKVRQRKRPDDAKTLSSDKGVYPKIQKTRNRNYSNNNNSKINSSNQPKQQSKSLEHENQNQISMLNEFIENVIHNSENRKPRIQLKPIKMKQPIRTEKSDSKHLKIIQIRSALNQGQKIKKQDYNQEDHSKDHYQDSLDSIVNQRIHPQSIISKSIDSSNYQDGKMQQRYFSKNRSYNNALLSTEVENSYQNQRGKGQTKQIIDLLQGNTLRKNSKDEKASDNSVQEMKSIRSRMDDINKQIHKSIKDSRSKKQFNELFE